MDCLVHRVAKSWTRLSDFQLTVEDSVQVLSRRKMRMKLEYFITSYTKIYSK